MFSLNAVLMILIGWLSPTDEIELQLRHQHPTDILQLDHCFVVVWSDQWSASSLYVKHLIENEIRAATLQFNRDYFSFNDVLPGNSAL